MSDPVKLKITTAGLEAALNAEMNGIVIKLDKIRFSTDKFESVINDPRSVLNNVVHESLVSAGGTSISQNTLRLFTVVDSPVAHSIGSIGVYTEEGVLFAIASVETGELMKILPRITFIMSFGMTVNAMLLENITVVIDQETALAAAMMSQHELHPDPHPQYSAMINNLASNLANMGVDLESLIYSLNTAYPKHIMAGVGNGSVATIDTSEKITDLRDSRYSILLTPEGAHEAWSITRNEKSFTYNIFNRSGTNRIGYSGQVSWAIVQNSAYYKIGGNGEYSIAGTYHIPVLVGETKKITLIGGGGGGGGSRYTGGSNYEANNGKDGQATTITKGMSLLASADGGKGGTVGRWGNGSHYFNGEGGLGGTVTHNATTENILIASTLGVKGGETRADHAGGIISIDGGSGGNGKNGVGDEGWSYGGGGGSGSHMEFTYKNTSSGLVNLILVVGEGGLFPVGATDVGTNGGTGYALVQTLSEGILNAEFTQSGAYQVQVDAGATMRFDLVGAGGGGGSAVHQDSSSNLAANGKDGEGTSISIDGVIVALADSGKGGKLGWWDNGSAWRAGAGGLGGTVNSTNAINMENSVDGNFGTSVRYNYAGGASVSPILTYGRGGSGVAGIGNHADGWSGGGGSGAFLECLYHNASSESVIVEVKVGAGGAGGSFSNYAVGKDGSDGYVRVVKI